ncbi:hypothetical protein WS91_21235 [Burkholderia sp. MSMB1498]|nr:hypothetical protein WS91_21235 [Burkholderia sp. MSMB1498]
MREPGEAKTRGRPRNARQIRRPSPGRHDAALCGARNRVRFATARRRAIAAGGCRLPCGRQDAG